MSALSTALVEVSQTTDRLSRLSQRRYQNPYVHMGQWPAAVDPLRDWFTTPEYVSLHGTALWEKLDDTARCRVAFHEAAGFYSLNIHGEKGLIQGLAARLYRSDLTEISGYLHHFLDEENKHSVYFGGFCTRYARVHRSRQMSFGTTRLRDVDDFLFFARTLIFEEIVDHYNRVQARDARLHPLARFINESHHRDEARHLVFGRCLVTALWRACAPDWSPELIAEVRDDLGRFVTATWREFYHPDVYADAGLNARHASPALAVDDPWELAETAWSAPRQRAHRRAVSAGCLDFLTAAGILVRDPADAF